MNAKLRHYPAFADTAPVKSVDDCDSARQFMRAYANYKQAHPDFDFHEPLGTPPKPPSPLPSLPEPKLEVQKILNGTPVHVGPVVQLQGPPGSATKGGLASVSDCSGTFIAKNWILTAAHCLVQPFSGDLDEGGAPAYVLDDAGNPILDDAGQPTFVIEGFRQWTILWGDASGMAIPSSNTPSSPDVAARLVTYAYQYIDHRWVGSGFPDLGLLYLPSTQVDQYLPGSPDLGSAMPLSLVPPDGTQNGTSYGWGPNPNLQLEEADWPIPFADYVTDSTVDQWALKLVLPGTQGTSFSGPLECHGDSGGPAVRLNEMNFIGNAIQVGVAGFVDPLVNAGQTCFSTPGDKLYWTRTDLAFDFIEQHLQLWTPGFSCRRTYTTGGTPDYANCWGLACNDDSDCSVLGDGFYCGGSAAIVQAAVQALGQTGCPGCAGAGVNDCSCVVGQCLPTAAIVSAGRACTTDSDCAPDAPTCVFSDAGDDGGAIGICEPSPDGGP
jgi:hypothetical protein